MPYFYKNKTPSIGSIVFVKLNTDYPIRDNDVGIYMNMIEYNNLEAVSIILDRRYNINFDKMDEGKTLLDFSVMYHNKFINNNRDNMNPILRDFIIKRDMERNLAIVNKLLGKKLSKKTIENARILAQKEKKAPISRRLLEYFG